MDRFPYHPKRSFGQNFLQDPGIIQRIIEAIGPQPDQHLVEIGPGLGALTRPLLTHVHHLDVVELDRDLAEKLKSLPQFPDHLTIHQADALTFHFDKLMKDDHKLRILGNLPYNISTPLIFHLLAHIHCIADMHFMLQKEVVDRLAAQPGDTNFSRLSVMVQYFCHATRLFDVDASAFYPTPGVQSAIVRLIPHPQLPHKAHDLKQFAILVRQAFNQRRKTLRNALKDHITVEQFEACHIDPNRRPQELSVGDYVKLANI